ncbi:MAG: DMT family transporter [Rhodobacteraceae bacterium]|nr:DMT family transporter [Paracoccaceae bacterium]
MQAAHLVVLASATVFILGAIWGLYWLPVRALGGMGLPGPAGTAAITAAAVLILAPFVLRQPRIVLRTDPLAMAGTVLGGAAFALYSVGFLYGDVALIILLFYLTPVWSTLFGRVLLGWVTPPVRRVAIIMGLAALTIMLGGDGDLPVPQGLGEWMGLFSGLLWSISTICLRVRPEPPATLAAFVFAFGALTTAMVMMPWLGPGPPGVPLGDLWPALGLAALTGAIWWVPSLIALMWAVPKLDPARVGILLMAEVMVGLISAALLSGEDMSVTEMLGGALVLAAALLELWPLRRR